MTFLIKHIIMLLKLPDTNDYEQLCEVIKSKARIVGGFIFIGNLYKHDIVTYEIVLSY